MVLWQGRCNTHATRGAMRALGGLHRQDPVLHIYRAVPAFVYWRAKPQSIRPLTEKQQQIGPLTKTKFSRPAFNGGFFLNFT
jgi:hypothetical protein